MKNIIITGANQGIGYYFVKSLLERGYCAAVLDIQIDGLEELKKTYSGTLLTLKCDVRDAKAVNDGVKKAFQAFGSIDIAVHNACVCSFDSAMMTDEKTYFEIMDVNYFGALRLAKAVIPYMMDQKYGKVFFTSSGVGVMGFNHISPYASSKGAIESLAKCLRIEHKKDNITFHLLHPPLTATKSSEPLPIPKEFMASPEKVGAGLAKNINKKRFIICHSAAQKIQTLMCYLFPLQLGALMSKMTGEYVKDQN